MQALGVVIALAMIAGILVDAFESILLPRRISHSFRLARIYYRSTWLSWRWAARRLPAGRRRNAFFSYFGPLSLFGLLCVWAVGLIVAFALLHWSLGTELSFVYEPRNRFFTYVYFSGTTFLTLGYGDLVPVRPFGRMLSVAEAGIGFGFLAVVLSYLPVLYQSFSRRETTISLLDARAGSPPTAGELLRRLGAGGNLKAINSLLVEWERWAAELLENHVSFPVLRFYRSQHDNQSWLGALTTVLDTSALLIAGVDCSDDYQARLTFAIARHAAVDLGLVTKTRPKAPEPDRLPPDELARLLTMLSEAGLPMHDVAATGKALGELRALYEPFVNALATDLELTIPPFQPSKPPVDNWQTSPWMPRSPTLTDLPGAAVEDTHLD
ncbi:MAG TPA: ion channel [Pirellulales bacterium]|jgi:hypothetical protein|nr:ion channel [Pirellulales bacterium]